MAIQGSSSRSNSYYSGCHIRLQARVTSGDPYARRRITVYGNTFKGQRHGLRIGSREASGYNQILVSGNNICSARTNFINACLYDSCLRNKIVESGNVRFSQPVGYFPGNIGIRRAKMVKRIRIKGKSKVTVGKSIRLKLKFSPSKPSIKTVTWKVSNKKYASISSKGKLKARKAGKGKTVTVYAMAKDGSGIKAKKKIKILKKKKKKSKKKSSKKSNKKK